MRTMKLSVRHALAVSATAGLLLAVTVASPATALSPRASAFTVRAEQREASGDAVRSGSPDSAVDRVADFFGAYIDAVSDGTDDLSTELRAHYLTGDFRQRLAAWEEANHADGVLRA